MTESEFIQWLNSNYELMGNSLSSKSISALSDFCFGNVIFQELKEPLLIGFQTWLGVELGFLKPSVVRGGLWIGDSVTWTTMLRRTYDSEQQAYEAFFSMIAAYHRARKHAQQIFHLDGSRKETFLVKDYGSGLPQALETYSIENQEGVYVRASYANGETRMIGYFSEIDEVARQAVKTRVATANS